MSEAIASEGTAAGETLAARWRAISARVRQAAERAGRDPSDVTIVAVSKTHPAQAVREAVAAGVRVCGENYVQEMLAKQAELSSHAASSAGSAPAWHFIGRLQRNKVKQIAGKVELIHAVDSLELAREIAKRVPAGAPPQQVLLAVNLGGELTKSGLTGEDALAQARELAAIPNLAWRGLMTMPPPDDDAEAARPVFRALAELRQQLQQAIGQPLPWLSMGMSGDFEVAVAEGATHVRIGTAIFGSRPAKPEPGEAGA